MMIPIAIPDDMLTCFRQCARLRDYKMFFEEYRCLLNVISECLKSVSLPRYLECNFFSMHVKRFLKFLKNWDPRDDYQFPEYSYLQIHVPELCGDMKYCISQGNWNGFYWKYRTQIDYMIMRSRDQRVVDFQIECLGDGFESFEARDLVFNCRKSCEDYLPPYRAIVVCAMEERLPLKPKLERKSAFRSLKNLKSTESAIIKAMNVNVRVISSSSVPVSRSGQCECSGASTSTMVLDLMMGSCGLGLGTMDYAKEQCQYRTGIGLNKKIVLIMIQKEKEDQRLFFEREMRKLSTYQQEYEKLKKVTTNEATRTYFKHLQEEVQTKKLELKAELKQRQQNFVEQMRQLLEIMYPDSKIRIFNSENACDVNLDDDISIEITNASGKTWMMLGDRSKEKPIDLNLVFLDHNYESLPVAGSSNSASYIDLNLVFGDNRNEEHSEAGSSSSSSNADSGFHEMDDDRCEFCDSSIMDSVWGVIDPIMQSNENSDSSNGSRQKEKDCLEKLQKVLVQQQIRRNEEFRRDQENIQRENEEMNRNMNRAHEIIQKELDRKIAE